MVRLIFSIVFFVVFAVFTAMNARFTTTVDLFGLVLENVSIVAVVIITMALGVLYSFILYLSNYLAKNRAKRVKSQKSHNKEKAAELKEKAKAIDAPAPDGQAERKGIFSILRPGRKKAVAKPESQDQSRP